MNLSKLLEKITKDPRTFIGALVIICSFISMPIVFTIMPGISTEYFTACMFLLFTVVSYYFSAKSAEKQAPAMPIITDEEIDQFAKMIERIVTTLAERMRESFEQRYKSVDDTLTPETEGSV